MLTSLITLLNGILGLATPLIDDALAEKYNNAYISRLGQLHSIVQAPDTPERANELHSYFDQLCLQAGTPAEGLGTDISIPLDYLISLADIASAKIRDDAVMGQLMQKLSAK